MSTVACPLIITAMSDHIYGSCPALKRSGPHRQCVVDGCDPLDESVCGWCRRVWNARNR